MLWLVSIRLIRIKQRRTVWYGNYENKNSISKVFISKNVPWISIIICTVIIGLRQIDYQYGGSDSYGYVNQFLNIRRDFSINISEILFKVYMWVLRGVTDNWRFFVLLNTFIMAFALCYFTVIYYEKNRYIVAQFLLWPVFLYYSCCALRNGLAISFCLLASIALHKQKKYVAVLLSILGFLFHYSTIFYIGYLGLYLVIMRRRDNSKISRYLIIVLIIGVVVATFPLYSRIYYNSRYAFFQRQINASFFGFAPFYFIGLLTLWKHKRIIEKFGHGECVFGTYFLCVIIPVCIYFGLYRVPYYFIGQLGVCAADGFAVVNEDHFAKTHFTQRFYNTTVFAVFLLYGILKTWTIASDSGILHYKLF